MSYPDAAVRVAQIQQQLSGLWTASDPRVTAASTTTQSAASASGSTYSSASSSFANALAQAQSSSPAGTAQGVYSSGAAPVSLSATAQATLTSDQQQFASRLAAETGLDPQVISAWLLAEESGAAAQSRQAAGNNDWLNIGYTDTGTFGSTDSVWSSPVTAADATAGWLKGQSTIAGYGTASSGVQAILGAAGQSPSAQISAIQRSGWASSGYPDLPGLYQQLGG